MQKITDYFGGYHCPTSRGKGSNYCQKLKGHQSPSFSVNNHRLGEITKGSFINFSSAKDSSEQRPTEKPFTKIAISTFKSSSLGNSVMGYGFPGSFACVLV